MVNQNKMMSTLMLAALSTTCANRCDDGETVRTDVNFATGGSTTGSTSVNDAFAAVVPELGPLLAGLRGAGLDVYGLTRQVDFLTQTLNDVDDETDLFWVQGGTNSYLSDILTAQPFDPAKSPAEIRQAMERLYNEAGARRFLVPNLIPLGDAPIYQTFPPNEQVPDWKATMNYFTTLHNQILSGEVATFSALHEDAEVVFLDAAGAYTQFIQSNPEVNTVVSCNTPGLDLDLTAPNACDGYLYLDNVHPTSAAWANAAANATTGVNDRFGAGAIERLVSVGDSFSDVGSFIEAFGRGLGFGFEGAAGILAAPPLTEGRFTDAKNVVQMIEEGLQIATPATYFQQPKVSAFDIAREDGQKGKLIEKFELDGEVYVPMSLEGQGRGYIVVRFLDETQPTTVCRYQKTWRNRNSSKFDFKYCNRGVKGGDKIAVDEVRVAARRKVNSVKHDFLYL